MKAGKSPYALGTEREVSDRCHTVYFSNASLKLLLGITGVRRQQRQVNCTVWCTSINSCFCRIHYIILGSQLPLGLDKQVNNV